MLAWLRQAEEAERASGAPARPRLSLLVVDSPAALVAGALGGQGLRGAGHVIMACLARALRALARRFLLAVLTHQPRRARCAAPQTEGLHWASELGGAASQKSASLP